MVDSPGNIAFFDDPSIIVNNTNGRYPQGFRTPGIVRSITAVQPRRRSTRGRTRPCTSAGYVQDDWKVTPRLT